MEIVYVILEIVLSIYDWYIDVKVVIFCLDDYYVVGLEVVVCFDIGSWNVEKFLYCFGNF